MVLALLPIAAACSDAPDSEAYAMPDANVSGTDAPGFEVVDAGPSTSPDASPQQTVILDLTTVTLAYGKYGIPVRATQSASFSHAVITLCYDRSALDVDGGAYADYHNVSLAGFLQRTDDPCTDAFILFSEPIDYVAGTTLMRVLFTAPPTSTNIGFAGTGAHLGNNYGSRTLPVEIIAP